MSPPRASVVLVRYGEIGIKGQAVRNRFERILVDELRAGLQRAGVDGTVERTYGRIFVHADDADGAAHVASRTFGVVSASPAAEVEASPEAVAEALAEVSRNLLPEGASFAIRARRSGTHSFSSVDVARAAGTAVLEAHEGRGVSVDLDAPDVELHVEVRQEAAFVFTRTLEGPGGLPRGSQGMAVLLVTRPLDVLAGWLMLRRGCDLTLAIPEDADDDALEAVAALDAWAPLDTVEVEPGDAWGGAEAVAREVGARVLVAGHLLAEARTVPEVTPPVLQPLVGFHREALVELAERVGITPSIPEVVP